MHNLKEIRKNPANFKKKIEERNTKVSFDNLIELGFLNLILRYIVDSY